MIRKIEGYFEIIENINLFIRINVTTKTYERQLFGQKDYYETFKEIKGVLLQMLLKFMVQKE